MAGLERIRGEDVVRDVGLALPGRGRSGRGRVVRSLGRAVERPCARPGCAAPATATLRFAYAEREASVEPLADDRSPEAYDLCVAHAARTRPPHGWTLRDRRPEEDRRADADPPRETAPATPPDLGGDHTVAVLAAALRGAPVADEVVDPTRASEEPHGDPRRREPDPPGERREIDQPAAGSGPAQQRGPVATDPAAAVPDAAVPEAAVPEAAVPGAPVPGGAVPGVAAVTRPPLAVRRQREVADRTEAAADW